VPLLTSPFRYLDRDEDGFRCHSAVEPAEWQSCGEYCSPLFLASWDARLLVGPCCAEPLQIANELQKEKVRWKN